MIGVAVPHDPRDVTVPMCAVIDDSDPPKPVHVAVRLTVPFALPPHPVLPAQMSTDGLLHVVPLAVACGHMQSQLAGDAPNPSCPCAVLVPYAPLHPPTGAVLPVAAANATSVHPEGAPGMH